MKEQKKTLKQWKSQQHVPNIQDYLPTLEDTPLKNRQIHITNERHKTMQPPSLSHIKFEDEYQPYRIKDFIPSISPQIKSELIKNNRNNFLDFLLVQKIGKSGDQKFFNSLVRDYNFDPYKKSLMVKEQENPKNKISYLQRKDEKASDLDKQVHQVFHNKRKEDPNQGTPLDKMIIQKNQYTLSRLPKCRVKLESLKQRQ